MVVVEGVARKLYPETNIWEVSRPVLEEWLKDTKRPKSTINTAINTSSEILKRMPELPQLMDRADYALKLMAEGKTPEQALKILTDTDPGRDLRQVGMVDAQGRVGSFTGTRCNAWAGHKVGKYYAAQGNILTGEAVVKNMAIAFEKARNQPNSQLADWLVAAVIAAEAAGGDKRGRQSAALVVVRDQGGYAGLNDRFIDIRVEDHKTPIKELARLLELHKQFYPHSHRNKPSRKK